MVTKLIPPQTAQAGGALENFYSVQVKTGVARALLPAKAEDERQAGPNSRR